LGLTVACSSGATTSVQVTAPGGGNGRVTLTPEHAISAAELAQAASIITRRLQVLGVGGVRVTAGGPGLLVSGTVGPSALSTLAQVATVGGLTFRPVVLDGSGEEEIFAGAGPPPGSTATGCATAPPSSGPVSSAAPSTGGPTGAGAATTSPAVTSPALTQPGTPPAVTCTVGTSQGPALTSAAVLDDPNAIDQTVVLPLDPQSSQGQVTERYVVGPVLRDGAYVFTGQIIASAQANLDQTGEWTVLVSFTGRGGSEWDTVVGERYYQRYIAIILDNRVESAPQIQAQQFNGQATISGGGSAGFTKAQAELLAAVLSTGALPVGFTLQSSNA
jgi:preprotein translocase subunit SecD